MDKNETMQEHELIETFANITTKTLAGRMIYPIADKFIVQWDSMKKLYPKAEVGGWIF